MSCITKLSDLAIIFKDKGKGIIYLNEQEAFTH